MTLQMKNGMRRRITLVSMGASILLLSMYIFSPRQDRDARVDSTVTDSSAELPGGHAANDTTALESPTIVTGDDDTLRSSVQHTTSTIEDAARIARDAQIPLLPALNDVEMELVREQIAAGMSSLSGDSRADQAILGARNHALTLQFLKQLEALELGQYLVLPDAIIYSIEDRIYKKRPESRVVSMAPLLREDGLCQVVFVLDQSESTELGIAFRYYYSVANSGR